jgi:hypothetical protein
VLRAHPFSDAVNKIQASMCVVCDNASALTLIASGHMTS